MLLIFTRVLSVHVSTQAQDPLVDIEASEHGICTCLYVCIGVQCKRLLVRKCHMLIDMYVYLGVQRMHLLVRKTHMLIDMHV